MLYTNNLERFYSSQRKWQGIPAIERTNNGKIFVAFYSGGENEEMGNYCILLQVDDNSNFSEPIAAIYDGEDSRCFDPCLWIDPIGRLWFIWSTMPEVKTWASICENPDKKLNWSEPFVIGSGIMINKPTVLDNGNWLFPLAVWTKEVYDFMIKHCINIKINMPEAESLAYAVESRDKGKTFKQLGGVRSPNPSFDEHMFVERKDGSVAVYIRDKKGIAMAVSNDKGCSWSKAKLTDIKNPDTRFFIRRTISGNLLLINHVNFTGRNNLTALISEDDGKTWKGGLLLDERNNISYPDGVESKDGYFYIIYDRERGSKNQGEGKHAKEILMAKFTEKDILAKKIVSVDSSLKVIVSKLY